MVIDPESLHTYYKFVEVQKSDPSTTSYVTEAYVYGVPTACIAVVAALVLDKHVSTLVLETSCLSSAKRRYGCDTRANCILPDFFVEFNTVM